MSVKLKRVELENIRSHKHVVFEPEAQGITAISGPNGTGKSTIVDSIAWALYGTKPQGVSKASEIFRNGIDDKDKAFAIVDLEVDGTLLRIERRRVNKNGAVECEVSKIVIEDNGGYTLENLAGPSVSHAEIYMRRNLKMDEKGFLAAVLVQQKQVDQLISAGPRERGAVIERLTGIASITSALVESRQEYNTLKKTASFSTVDESELSKLTEEKEESKTELSSKQELLNKIKAQAGELKVNGSSLKKKLADESEKLKRHSTLETNITSLSVKIETKRDELVGVTADKDNVKKKLSLVSSSVNIVEIKSKIDELKRTIRSEEFKSQAAENEKSKSESLLEINNKIVEESNWKTLAKVKKDLKTAVSERNTSVDTKDTLSQDNVELLSSNKKLDNAIKILSKGDDCPTCLQKVEDSKAAIDALSFQKQSNSDAVKENKEKILENVAIISEKSGLIEKAEEFIEAFESRESLEDLVSDYVSQLNSTNSSIRVFERELSGLEKIYQEAKNHEDTKNSYDRLLIRAKKLTSDIEDHEEELRLTKNEVKEMGSVSSDGVEKLREKLDKLRAEHSKLSMRHSKVNGEYELLKQRITHLDENIERHEKEIKKYNDLLKSVEIAGSAVDLISEFREERVRNSIPVIEVYASDLINRFTDGQFTRLKLDQKFNATVVLANGNERAVGLLSGGELSAASMSLRLAISMLLNSGGSNNLIILDEVLVSQDANRAELILSTVKEVSQGQVILIAHNDSIDSIADKIVTLSPTK